MVSQPEIARADSRAAGPVFTAAPHRMMFFGGAVQLLAVMVFWLTELGARYAALWPPPPLVVPAMAAHAFLMLYTVFPFFMFGFLMTTYPRWMNGTPVPRRHYLPAFVLLATGVVLFYVGLFVSAPLMIAAVVVLLAGWGVGVFALLQVFARAPARDKRYERQLNVALLCGWLGVASYAVWLLDGRTAFLTLSLTAGLWLFLVPVLVLVSHRMIPYFSSTALTGYQVVQPNWSLPVLVLCTLGHTALAVTGHPQWTFVPDFTLALLAVHHSWHWGLRLSLQVRLLAMLHIAFAWLAVGMALYGAQSLALLLTGRVYLGQAPLHALTIGFITSMTVAMASRVTLGHSGRGLQADAYTWACFWGVGLAAALRVLADLPGITWSGALQPNLLAALVWLVALGAWVGRYLPMYIRRRADGRPG